MEGQSIALFVVGVLLSCIGVLIATLVSQATKTFSHKIDELMGLYGMTLEELKEISKRVDVHEVEIQLNKKDISTLQNS